MADDNPLRQLADALRNAPTFCATMLAVVLKLHEEHRHSYELIFGVIKVELACYDETMSASALVKATKPEWRALITKFGLHAVNHVAGSIEKLCHDEVAHGDRLRLLASRAQMEELD